MTALPVMTRLGEPEKRLKTAKGELEMWAVAPFLVTRVEGYATIAVAVQIDAFYKSYFPKVDEVVTIHDWSKLSDYDTECRKILQNTVQYMRSKQREIIIHLGPADSLGQKIIRTTSETIQRFKRLPIEIFSDDDRFQERLRLLYAKYGLS